MHVDVKGKWLEETDYIYRLATLGVRVPTQPFLQVLQETVLLGCANSEPLPENAVSTH